MHLWFTSEEGLRNVPSGHGRNKSSLPGTCLKPDSNNAFLSASFLTLIAPAYECTGYLGD